jgi:hypothetical protein
LLTLPCWESLRTLALSLFESRKYRYLLGAGRSSTFLSRASNGSAPYDNSPFFRDLPSNATNSKAFTIRVCLETGSSRVSPFRPVPSRTPTAAVKPRDKGVLNSISLRPPFLTPDWPTHEPPQRLPATNRSSKSSTPDNLPSVRTFTATHVQKDGVLDRKGRQWRATIDCQLSNYAVVPDLAWGWSADSMLTDRFLG